MDYYKETERRLYNYFNIEFAIERRRQQIEKLEGSNQELISQYDMDIKSFEAEIIDMKECLSRLNCDRDFKYLEFIYRDRYSYQQIADKVNLDRSCISRHKALIVNKLKIMLYPELIFDTRDI